MGSSPGKKQARGGPAPQGGGAPQGSGGPIAMPGAGGPGTTTMFQPTGNVMRPTPPPGAIPGAVGVNYMPPQAGGMGGMPERDMLAMYQMLARQNQRPGGGSRIFSR